MAKANDRKEKVAEEFLDQDVYQPVPMGERAAWYSFLAIFIGMWASLAAMGAGVDLGMFGIWILCGRGWAERGVVNTCPLW